MKKVFIITLVLLLLVCMSSVFAGSAGTSTDPLITLSYLTNKYVPALIGEGEMTMNEVLDDSYNEALTALEELYDNYLLKIGGYPDYTLADSYVKLSITKGNGVNLLTGGSFVLTSGSATLTITKGTVVNIATGASIASGSSLQPNLRYFCAENTAVVFVAASDMTCLIDGYYLSNGSIIEEPDGFIDVADTSWYYDAVRFVRDNGLFSGTSSTTFGPDIAMTRGMFVTVLYRLAGEPSVSASSAFSDVKSSSLYYYDPVVWANQNGIVSGYSDGTFRPEDNITREQMAFIMYQYASYTGYSVSNINSAIYNAFPDTGNVSSYAVNAMKWSTYKGILNGSDGYLLPKNTATRAHVAQIIMNFCQKIAGM